MSTYSATAKRKSGSDECLPADSKEIKRSKPNKTGAQAAKDTDAPEIEDEEHDPGELTAEALKTYSKGTARKAKAELLVADSVVDRFTAKVEEKRRVLLSILEEKCDELSTLHNEASSNSVSFAREQTLLPVACRQADHARTVAIMASPHISRRKLTTTSHPYHEQSLRLFESCNTVLVDYESIETIMDHCKEKLKVGESWYADKQHLLQVLEAGKRHTIEEIKKRMFREEKDAKRNDKTDGQKVQEREVDKRLVEELSKQEGVWQALREAPGGLDDKVESQSWAEYTGKMEKGVKRLARCLPEDILEGQWA